MEDIPEIQIQEARKKLARQECTFVDIRDPGSYHAGRIPGAIHLHDGTVREFVVATDKERALVVYCYHGHSSLAAVAYLRDNGFKNVASMAGGFEAWRQTYDYEAG